MVLGPNGISSPCMPMSSNRKQNSPIKEEGEGQGHGFKTIKCMSNSVITGKKKNPWLGKHPPNF